MTWEDLLARPRHRDADGILVVLEEVDDDTGTGTYRRAGASRSVRAADPSDFKPRSEFALEVKVLDGEVVDDDREPPAPASRARLVAAGVAAAGLAWLASRRRG